MNTPNATKLHCPNCKSHNISISTESSVGGAVTSTHGNMSVTSVSNTHRNFWFCSDCGTKFRNIQNLEEEIHKCRYTHIILWVFAAILSFTFIKFIISLISHPIAGGIMTLLFFPTIIGTFTGAVVCIIMGFVSKSKLDKKKKELEYLKENCFN